MSYKAYYLSLLPTPLQGPPGGEPWASGFANHVDDLLGEVRDGVRRRFPSVIGADGDDLALAYMGSERGLPRYPSETDAVYAERLRTAWGLRALDGTEAAIVTELTGLGFSGITVMEYKDWPTAPAPLLDANGDPWWSRFWVIIEQYNGADIAVGGILGAMVLGTDPLGISVGEDVILQAKKAILARKPAHALAVSIIFLLDGTPLSAVLGIGVLGTMVLGVGLGSGSVQYIIDQ